VGLGFDDIQVQIRESIKMQPPTSVLLHGVSGAISLNCHSDYANGVRGGESEEELPVSSRLGAHPAHGAF